MGALQDQISEEIKTAMKAKDKIRLNALRFLKKLFIENDTSGKPQPELDIVISYAKKLKDSLSLYPADSQQREDLMSEIKVLDEFLPEALTVEEVQMIIDQIKAQLEGPNMGSIMKELTPQIKGKFDGKLASELVKETLK